MRILIIGGTRFIGPPLVHLLHDQGHTIWLFHRHPPQVTLPEGVSAADVLRLAIDEKVAFVPGAPFHPLGGGENTFRLNFSMMPPEKIREGITRLGRVVTDALTSAETEAPVAMLRH
mgnify:CR=1 FL=1